MDASIDAGIAELVREIWRAQIQTHTSCEDAGTTCAPDRFGRPRKGRAQLGFPSEREAVRFLTLVAEFQKAGRTGRTLYNRMTINGYRDGGKHWDYQVSIFDHRYDRESDSRNGGAEIGFRVFIYFPVADIPVLVKRLRRVRERRESVAKTQQGARTSRRAETKPAEIHGPDAEVTLSLPAAVHAGVKAFAKRLAKMSESGVTFDEAAIWLLKDALDDDPRVLEEVSQAVRVWKESAREDGHPATEESLRRLIRVARGRARAEAHIDELLAIPPLPGNALSLEAAVFLPRALSERLPARGPRRRSAIGGS